MNRPALISTLELTKYYGKFAALRQLSLEILQGEIFGLLGPNGSGKTTTLRILLGLLRPTSGSAAVSGFDCWSQSLRVRRLVSYLPGELRIYGSMTGLAAADFFRTCEKGTGWTGPSRLAERIMGLNLRKKVRAYSTGMKQKLALSLAFADPVDILILDEPTSALDPSARSQVLQLVKEAKAQGQTVIFSGHVLSEVEAVSDRLAILRRGRLMHVEDMNARRGLRMLLIRFPHEPPSAFPDELELTLRETTDRTCLLEHRGALGPLLGWLAATPIEDVAIGTEDLLSLYNRYHGPDAGDEREEEDGRAP